MNRSFFCCATLLIAGLCAPPALAQYFTPEMEVTAPAAIAGVFAVGTAPFGPSLQDAGPVASGIVWVSDEVGDWRDACEPLSAANAAVMAGNIAIMVRGSCNFAVKAKNAQDAGAVAVIIGNSVPGDAINSLAGSDPTLTIPTIAVSNNTYLQVTAELPGVSATLRAREVSLAGPTDCSGGSAGAFPCNGIDAKANLGLSALTLPGGTEPSGANDIWGWTDSASGREFALVGLIEGTAFVEVTTPEAPVYLGTLPTATDPSSWRDIKTYADHAFVVSEASGHGIQVFDLSRLLTVASPPVTFTDDARYTGIGSAHNIVINEATGFAYAVGARQSGGLPAACDVKGFHAVDISTPTSPTFSACFSDVASESGPRSAGYTHDAQCVVYSGPDTDHTGKEICFAANEDVVTLFDVTDKTSVTMLAQVGYPTPVYTHQGWLTADQRYLIVNDEIDELNIGGMTRTLVMDLADLDNPDFGFVQLGTTSASDHNLYVHNGMVFQSNYEAGLRVLDVSTIGSGSMAELAYFDTWPESDNSGFNGQWSNYPYFASGTLIVSDRRAGLFVLALADPPLAATLEGTNGYRVLAAPAGDSYDELLAPFWTQGFTGSNDPAGGCSVYTFDETVGSFATGYNCLSDQGAPFARGAGVFAFIYADDDATIPGVQGGFPKTLSVPDPGVSAPFSAFPLTYTDNVDRPAVEEGWNLLGNPLGTAFDWDDTVRGGGLTATIYVYDPNYFGGDYRTWSAGVGGDLVDGVVPALQGFFAKAVAASPTLEVPLGAVVDPGPDVYGKTVLAPLRFELAHDDAPVSAAFVAIAPEASGAALGLDVLDAHRLTPSAWPRTVLSTYTVGDAEALPLAMNVLPLEASGEIELPLEVTAEGHTAWPLALSLTWDGALPEGWTATLVDRETNTTTEIVEGGRYAFALDVAADAAKSRLAGLGMGLPDLTPEAAKAGTHGSTGERFVLRLTPASVTSTDSPEASGALALLAPMPNPASGVVTLTYSVPASGEVALVVYDALGREVAVAARGSHSAGAHEARVDVRSLSPGVYVARLASGEASSTQRFTVVR